MSGRIGSTGIPQLDSKRYDQRQPASAEPAPADSKATASQSSSSTCPHVSSEIAQQLQMFRETEQSQLPKSEGERQSSLQQRRMIFKRLLQKMVTTPSPSHTRLAHAVKEGHHQDTVTLLWTVPRGKLLERTVATRGLDSLEQEVITKSSEFRDDLAAIIGDNTGSRASPLLQAVSVGNSRSVGVLLSMVSSDRMVDVFESQGVNGDTVLHEAIAKLDAPLVEFESEDSPVDHKSVFSKLWNTLPQEQLDRIVGIRDSGGNNLLRLAAKSRDPEVFGLLFNSLSPWDQARRRGETGPDGQNLLEYIGTNGTPDAALILVDHQPPSADSLMLETAKSGNTQVFRALLHNHPNTMNAKTPYGNTPLHLAAAFGYDEIVNELLAARPDALKEPGHNNRVPLHSAAARGQTSSIEILLNHDPNGSGKRDMFGERAIHLAAFHGHRKSVEILLNHDPNSADARNDFEETPLHSAAARGFVDVVQILLNDHPERANVIDQDGDKPSDISQNQEVFDLLQAAENTAGPN